MLVDIRHSKNLNKDIYFYYASLVSFPPSVP